MLSHLLNRQNPKIAESAHGLYVLAVDRARAREFYEGCSVPDSVDGRFDLIVLHLFLIMDSLGRFPGRDSGRLRQKIFDVFFADMDQSLREMGVGDLGVPRRIKAMMQAFNGRCHAYRAGLDGGKDSLRGAIIHNIYRDVPPQGQGADKLADYVISSVPHLSQYQWQDFLDNRVRFLHADS